jgi:hypothetical protein
VIGGQDVGRRAFAQDGHSALLFGERPCQAPALLLFFGQNAQSLLRAGSDLGRVRAEKLGRTRNELAAVESVVEGDVVALEAPAPRLLGARLAEERDEVERRVSARVAFQLAQGRLHVEPDRLDLAEPVRAEDASEEPFGGPLGCWRQVAIGETGPGSRGVCPGAACVALEGNDRFGAEL